MGGEPYALIRNINPERISKLGHKWQAHDYNYSESFSAVLRDWGWMTTNWVKFSLDKMMDKGP